MSYV
ncbi:uncharacterized protein FTOL_13980 [Fusarium torulosum]|jgi:hypothetical protein